MKRLLLAAVIGAMAQAPAALAQAEPAAQAPAPGSAPAVVAEAPAAHDATVSADTVSTDAAQPAAADATGMAATGAEPAAAEAGAAPVAEDAAGHAAEIGAEHVAEPAAEHGAGEHAAGAAAGHGAADAGAHAESGEPGAAHGNPIAPWVNFGIFVFILFIAVRKQASAFFRARRSDIVHSLESAAAAQRDAQAKLAETEERLAGIDGQVADILSKAREQAEAERALILEQAKADASRILSQAEAQVGDMEAASVRRLKTVAADIAVDLAREILEKQMQGKDREEFFNRTLTRLEKAAS